jgi:uncharacterized membrane protein YfcA
MIVEVLIYLIAATSAVFIAGYSVHMFVGGLVSAEVENQLMALVCLIVVCVSAYMAWDVIRNRSMRK